LPITRIIQIKKNLKTFLTTSVLSIITILSFYSCQKAAPHPYSDPLPYSPAAISPITFSAAVNNSSLTSFTPSKVIVGNYVTLKGTTSYYTITISFPSSMGPGDYFMGTHTSDLRATVTSGSITYINNANVSEAGDFEITSIEQGNYSATFTFFADDSTAISNQISVTQGTISNL
jgi:hypothetical protein